MKSFRGGFAGGIAAWLAVWLFAAPANAQYYGRDCYAVEGECIPRQLTFGYDPPKWRKWPERIAAPLDREIERDLRELVPPVEPPSAFDETGVITPRRANGGSNGAMPGLRPPLPPRSEPLDPLHDDLPPRSPGAPTTYLPPRSSGGIAGGPSGGAAATGYWADPATARSGHVLAGGIAAGQMSAATLPAGARETLPASMPLNPLRAAPQGNAAVGGMPQSPVRSSETGGEPSALPPSAVHDHPVPAAFPPPRANPLRP